MSIPLIVIIIYILVLFSISFIARRFAQNNNTGFVLAGRQLKTPLVMLNVVGIAIGGASTIGVAESAYKIGLSAGWYNGAWSVAALLFGYFLAGKYRQANFTTIAEFLERYYGSGCSILTVIAQIIIQVVVTALQYIAGGSILHALLPDVFTFELGLVTSAVVFVATTFIGGLWSASISNILNTVLIYGGILLAAVACLSQQGGMTQIALSLPTDTPYLSYFDGAGMATIITWFSVMIPMVASLQGVIQISSSAIDTKSAIRGYMLAGLLIFPMGFISALLGIIAKSMFPSASATTAMPMAIMTLDPWLAGITLAALWAADISTACSMLLGAGTMFSQDIVKKLINPNISGNKALTITRISVLVLGVTAYFLAGKVSGILSTIMIGLSLTAAFTLLMVCTLYFPKLCRRSSGFWTLLAGLITLFIWQLFPAVRLLPHLIYAEWLVCITVFAIVYFVDKRPIDIR